MTKARGVAGTAKKALKTRLPRPASKIEEALALQVRVLGLPAPIREYRFAAPRRWRADFAWPEHWLIVECEGAVWTGGRHTRGSGFVADMEKYNAATAMGYRVLRFDQAAINSGEAIRLIEWILKRCHSGFWHRMIDGSLMSISGL
jgi:very-short-patch-repair endonuclease